MKNNITVQMFEEWDFLSQEESWGIWSSDINLCLHDKGTDDRGVDHWPRVGSMHICLQFYSKCCCLHPNSNHSTDLSLFPSCLQTSSLTYCTKCVYLHPIIHFHRQDHEEPRLMRKQHVCNQLEEQGKFCKPQSSYRWQGLLMIPDRQLLPAGTDAPAKPCLVLNGS